MFAIAQITLLIYILPKETACYTLNKSRRANPKNCQQQLMCVSGSESFFALGVALSTGRKERRPPRCAAAVVDGPTAHRIHTGSDVTRALLVQGWWCVRRRRDVTPCPCKNRYPACATLLLLERRLRCVDPLWADRNRANARTDWSAAARLIPRRKRRCGAASSSGPRAACASRSVGRSTSANVGKCCRLRFCRVPADGVVSLVKCTIANLLCR